MKNTYRANKRALTCEKIRGYIREQGLRPVSYTHLMQLADTIKVVYEGKLYDGGAHGDLTEEEIGLIMMGGKSDEK